MYIIISYDIPDDRRCTKVMKTLKNFGAHVQYSVFECDLKREDYARLRKTLRPLLNLQEDNLRFYVLNKEDLKKRRVWGVERRDPKIKPWYLLGGPS